MNRGTTEYFKLEGYPCWRSDDPRPYLRPMLKRIREALQAVVAIAALLGELVDVLRDAVTHRTTDEAILQRLADVELQMQKHYAEAEGLLLKAGGHLRAARSAEERARRFAESAEEGEEQLSEEERAALEALRLQQLDALGGPGEGVQPVRENVAAGYEGNGKAAAFRKKWG